jgi:uncharacterized heparinase superfamily protein
MQLVQLVRSLRHTRPGQIRARLAKIVRRALFDRLGPEFARRALVAPLPQVRENAPKPVFSARLQCAESTSSDLRARLLATTHSLTAPIDWHPRGWTELARMNLHYMEFLEALDDAEFARIALDWIERNPAGERGGWRFAWNSYVLSLRVVVWMQQLAVRRARLTKDTVASMHASLATQLRFLERNLELDVGGNHLLKNAKALLWAGRYFDGDEARRWVATGERLLAGELAEQILPDGMHFERSPSYHAQVFADLLECADALDAGPLRVHLMTRLDASAQVLVDLTHPDGLPSLFNDGGLHMSYGTAECLAAWERMGGRTPRKQAVFALKWAGYYGVREGASYVLADCGPIAPEHLPAHGHGDILAFEWTVAGRRFIVDAGVFEYERGVRRAVSRASATHNTVTLDDRDQCEFWAAFRVGRRARVQRRRYEEQDAGFVLEGAHDGYEHLAGAPRHIRTLRARADEIRVDDRITGGAGQRVRARLLLHPDVRVERSAAGLRLTSGDVVVELDCAHVITLVDASWCPDFGVSLPTRQIVIEYAPAPSSGSFQLKRVDAASAAVEPPSITDRSGVLERAA